MKRQSRLCLIYKRVKHLTVMVEARQL
jgi:hypothetical protein